LVLVSFLNKVTLYRPKTRMYQTIDIAMKVKFAIDKFQKTKMEFLVNSNLDFFYTINSIQNKKIHVSKVTFCIVSSPISIKQNLNNIKSIFNIPQLNNPASSKMDSGFMVTSSRISHNQNNSFDRFKSFVLWIKSQFINSNTIENFE